MSKRVRFDEESIATKAARLEDNVKPSTSKVDPTISGPGSRFKEDHSLDSDEEDEDRKKKEDYEKLTEEDVEGAEDEENYEKAYEEDEGCRITPFNLKEEMEEGDFDTTGHYHFNKDKEIHDNWLDNIDWVKIKKKKKDESEEMMTDDDKPVDFDEVKILEEMVKLMNKGETVSKSLRRLGGSDKNKKKSKQRSWKREKVYDLEAGDEVPMEDSDKTGADEEEMKNRFLQLTELADQMAGAGHYDVYTDTFEKLQHKLNSFKMSKSADIPDDVDSDDALDIFADNIDSAKLDKPEKKDESETKTDNTGGGDEAVRWEYKWSEEDKEVYGPFTCDQMTSWKNEGFFNDKVKVRKFGGGDAPFYNAKRIDFDLYD